MDYVSDSTLKALNVVAYVSMITVRSFITFDENLSKKNFLLGNNSHNEASSEYYLLPEQYTFGIWGLICILLGCFVIYQWTESANDVTVDGIQCYFCTSSVLNIIWLIIIWVRGLMFQ